MAVPYSALDPAVLRNAISNGTDLKASITTKAYRPGEGGGPIYPPTQFVFDVDTTNVGTGDSATNQFFLYVNTAAGTINATVYWGDGTSDVITSVNAAEKLHTYPAPGIYEVIVEGTYTGFEFYGNDGRDRLKWINIKNWGPARSRPPTAGANWFEGCENLAVSAVDNAVVQQIQGMFDYEGNGTGLGASIVKIEGSSGTSAYLMFSDSRFSGQLQIQPGFTWTATTAQGMFERNGPTMTSQPLRNYTFPAALTNADEMYRYGRFLDGDFSITFLGDVELQRFLQTTAGGFEGVFNGDVSSLFNSTGSPTRIISAFENCLQFTGKGIGSWNTSELISATNAFYGCRDFDTSLGGWDISNMGFASNLMDGPSGAATPKLSTANYDATLGSWADQTPQPNISTHFGNSERLHVGGARYGRTHLIEEHGWTITDGGLNRATVAVPYIQSDGTGNAATTAGTRLLNANVTMTVSAWILRDYTDNVGQGRWLCGRGNQTNDQRGWGVWIWNAGTSQRSVRFASSSTGTSYDFDVRSPTNRLFSNIWQHVAVTVDLNQTGLAQVQMYIDGVDQTLDTTPPDISSILNTDDNFKILGMEGSASDGDADLYDLRVYDRHMTAQEIRKIGLDAGNVDTIFPANLVGHWPCNDASFNPVDVSGQNQNTTGVNNSSWTFPNAAPYIIPTYTPQP